MNGGTAPAFAGTHPIQPLPFDPARLNGLSERLISSHHDNNYGSAVNSLNKVEAELARVTKDTPPFVVSGLKRNELVFRNSMVLHEHYFGNLGGNGIPSGAIEAVLAKAYGSFANWEEHFRATGLSLAGGSGWAVVAFDFQAGGPCTTWAGDHTQALSYSRPLLVMDMYEHAYQMDYGAQAAKYIDAFFKNVNWDEVNKRLEQARALHV